MTPATPIDSAANWTQLAAQLQTPDVRFTDREALLYARFVKALALLCECEPYVDEPHYADQIDALLTDACASYPLEWQHCGGRRELAVRKGPREAQISTS